LVKTPYCPDIVKQIKTIADRIWDPTHQVWIIPDTRQHLDALLSGLYQTGLFTSQEQPAGIPAPADDDHPVSSSAEATDKISQGIDKVMRYLRLNGYSRHTVKAYTNQLEQFFSPNRCRTSGGPPGNHSSLPRRDSRQHRPVPVHGSSVSRSIEAFLPDQLPVENSHSRRFNSAAKAGKALSRYSFKG
jgi:hypothetical protein